MKKLMVLLGVFCLLGGLVGCSKKPPAADPPPVSDAWVEKVNDFVKSWNGRGGDQLIVVKTITKQDDWAVFQFQDGSGEYVAFDLGDYVTGSTPQVTSDYIDDGTGIIKDNLQISGWDQDAGKNIYTAQDGTLFEETTSSARKDLESLGANIESFASEELSYNLEENYGLSEERAASVAKITSSFQKIQNKRALTAKEMNIYTTKVLGVSYDAGKKALEKHIQGDSADMEAMMGRAAELNGTSPEEVQDLIGEYLL